MWFFFLSLSKQNKFFYTSTRCHYYLLLLLFIRFLYIIITRQLSYKIAISEKTNVGIDDFFSQDLYQCVTNKNSKIKHRLT